MVPALVAVPTPQPALPALTALLTALARRAADCTRVSMKVASSVDTVGSDETGSDVAGSDTVGSDETALPSS